MKCGYCKEAIPENGNDAPTLKIERVFTYGGGKWKEDRHALVCPVCDAFLGLFPK